MREKETEVQTEAAGSEAMTEPETAGSEQQTQEAEDAEAESEMTDIDADEFDDLVEQAQNQDCLLYTSDKLWCKEYRKTNSTGTVQHLYTSIPVGEMCIRDRCSSVSYER